MTRGAAVDKLAARLQAASEFMREHDDFLVVSHVQPDGDAVSSTLAVGWMLAQLGKTYTMINEGRLPAKFSYLPNYERVLSFTEQAPSRLFRHVISVDCADYARIGKVSELFAEGAKLLNIDHHPTNDGFGACQLIVPDASATVEILYDLAVQMGFALDTDFGRCIYTGLLTDTGGFRYASVGPKVMQIAADLLKLGVNGHELAEAALEKMTVPQMKLLQKGLSTLRFSDDRKIAWVHISLEDMAAIQAESEDMDGLVNYPRNVEGVLVGLMFKQRGPLSWKISLRSNTVNVAEIAQKFGGGGHIRAAGCTVEGELQEVTERVVREVGSMLT
ncbi:exopolyphosphatase [Gordoniibacillus kamchatkensis]|uniref:Exopolyphosphatase n=1 Tax=Gordoniibacillus kamchatkensis TaxID=1590651 RepID=A0ABR5ADS8_9BACL|nr:bifunctional oligoribonuclease/PAP phosphatase NrnA [Paenibacillus sp. VKM B-2647]KIL39204.1 exopolyphosphatase [Paenibacillus sp. VKM B-2647]